MPLTLDELLAGAQRRAENALTWLRTEGLPALLGIGLEGGLDVRVKDGTRRGFLMSWAYVTDGRRGAHGCGGALQTPPAMVDAVVDQGIELAQVVDQMAGEDDTRSRQGAWGVLTRGSIERAFSFEIAVVNALAPFYNTRAYPLAGHNEAH